MLEMSKAGKDHRQAVFVCRLDTFFVAHRAAGLDDCRDAEVRGFIDIVAEREKRVGSENRIF